MPYTFTRKSNVSDEFDVWLPSGAFFHFQSAAVDATHGPSYTATTEADEQALYTNPRLDYAGAPGPPYVPETKPRTVVEFGGTVRPVLPDGTLGDPLAVGGGSGAVDAIDLGSVAGAVTGDLNAAGNSRIDLTLTGDVVLTLSDFKSGASQGVIVVEQGSGGPHDFSVKVGSTTVALDVNETGATAVAWSTADGVEVDVFQVGAGEGGAAVTSSEVDAAIADAVEGLAVAANVIPTSQKDAANGVAALSARRRVALDRAPWREVWCPDGGPGDTIPAKSPTVPGPSSATKAKVTLSAKVAANRTLKAQAFTENLSTGVRTNLGSTVDVATTGKASISNVDLGANLDVGVYMAQMGASLPLEVALAGSAGSAATSFTLSMGSLTSGDAGHLVLSMVRVHDPDTAITWPTTGPTLLADTTSADASIQYGVLAYPVPSSPVTSHTVTVAEAEVMFSVRAKISDVAEIVDADILKSADAGQSTSAWAVPALTMPNDGGHYSLVVISTFATTLDTNGVTTTNRTFPSALLSAAAGTPTFTGKFGVAVVPLAQAATVPSFGTGGVGDDPESWACAAVLVRCSKPGDVISVVVEAD